MGLRLEGTDQLDDPFFDAAIRQCLADGRYSLNTAAAGVDDGTVRLWEFADLVARLGAGPEAKNGKPEQ